MGRKLVCLPEPEAGREATTLAPRDGTTTEVTTTEPTDDGTPTPKGRAAGWVEKVKETIPVEVVTAWIAIHALLTVGMDEPLAGYWPVFGVVLVATGLYMWVDVEVADTDETTWERLSSWERRLAVGSHVGLGMGAFVVWALYLLATGKAAVEPPFFLPGSEFVVGERHATVLLVVYTLVGPQLVPQLVSKVLGVRLGTPDRSLEDADGEETSD